MHKPCAKPKVNQIRASRIEGDHRRPTFIVRTFPRLTAVVPGKEDRACEPIFRGGEHDAAAAAPTSDELGLRMIGSCPVQLRIVISYIEPKDGADLSAAVVGLSTEGIARRREGDRPAAPGRGGQYGGRRRVVASGDREQWRVGDPPFGMRRVAERLRDLLLQESMIWR